MASIIKRTEDVSKACDAALAGIKQMREEALEYLVAEKMAETKIVRWGTAPKYASREAAIEALKQEKDFFGNRYSISQMLGWERESGLKKLKAMCKCAGVIRLETKDFNLVGGYLK
jgi:hypothetical protein